MNGFKIPAAFASFLLVGLTIGGLAHAQTHGLINNSKSPYLPLKSIDLSACRWTDGFWADKQKECVEVMVPNLGRLMDDPEIIHAFDNFRVAAGLEKGEFRGWSFTDGDFYKYVEAMAGGYELSKDPRIDQRMDEIIEVIGQAQRADGYIHTMIQIGHGVQGFRHEKEQKVENFGEPFTVGGKHEFYNFGHLMTAACVHYRVTGKTNFLDIAKKAADLLYAKFKNPPKNFADIDWNPPHLMGLVELYRTTGDKRYLNLAVTLVNVRGTGGKVTKEGKSRDESQKRIPIRKETEAVGHAGHGNYLYSGVADVYGETGDPTLRDALERIWRDVTTGKMYVTGATGQNHYGLTKRHELVSESYGESYYLPNINTYNETCANIGNAMWNWRMFLTGGEARFMDITELVFYNSALSGISLDGKQYFYTNPLSYIMGDPHNSKDDGKRSDFLSVFCCPPNIIRTIAEMQGYAYTTSEKGIWVNLYGSNALNTKQADGSVLKLTQKTDYPWDGKIAITVDAAEQKEFSMMLRIPAWAEGANLKVNGQNVRAELRPGSYFDLRRKWSAGDVVQLDLPMKPELIEGHPFIEEVKGQVAVKRGPLVYCLEAVDLPKGVKVYDVALPRNIELKPRFDDNLLSGITVLEGEADIRQEPDWSDQLYRKLPSKEPKKAMIRLIPYYAWANRGKSDMTVWMPLARD